MNTAEAILKIIFVSYDAPLEKARRWARSGDEKLKKEAVELLQGLFKKHPYALEIGQELVLALLECNRKEEAERTLEEIAPLHRNPNEEILCRWGRLYKEHGDRYANFTISETEGQIDNPAAAERYYRMALEKYDEAYQIRHGHYPGINKATLFLIVSVLSSDLSQQTKDRQESEQLTQELLERRSSWPHDLPDDNIWHPATEGEAHLLLQNWKEADQLYRQAQAQTNCQPFHRDSMRKQVERILWCFQQIKIDTSGFNIEETFPLQNSSNVSGSQLGAA